MTTAMRVTVTGASGFIGRRLLPRLEAAGHNLHLVGRAPKAGRPAGAQFSAWDPETGLPPPLAVDCDAIIHLAGEPVDQRWTPEAKRRIRDSRLRGTTNLVDAIRASVDSPDSSAARRSLRSSPDAELHRTPLQRFWALARMERRDVFLVVVYAAGYGLMSLAVPVAVETLVGTVAFGSLMQPIVTLMVLLAAALGFAALMRGYQFYVVELIQRLGLSRDSLTRTLDAAASIGWVQRNPEANRALMDDVADAIARGELRPVAPAVRPLEDAGAVLADLLERRAVGKTVLRAR